MSDRVRELEDALRPFAETEASGGNLESVTFRWSDVARAKQLLGLPVYWPVPPLDDPSEHS